jgi:DNA polymerase III delta prime subunit
MDWNFIQIKSGEMNDDAVNVAVRMMRQVGINDGWKLILCDEADMMTPKAKGLWLSILEDISDKTVIIFTTNDVEKFGQRFIDRCEHIKFERNAKVLQMDGQAYLNRLWIGEGLHGNPPNIEDCKGVIVSAAMSFRRIARFVESEMRKQSSKIQSAAVSTTISLSQHNASKGVRL